MTTAPTPLTKRALTSNEITAPTTMTTRAPTTMTTKAPTTMTTEATVATRPQECLLLRDYKNTKVPTYFELSLLGKHGTAFKMLPALRLPPPQVFSIAPQCTLSGAGWWTEAVYTIHNLSSGPPGPRCWDRVAT